MTINVLWIMCHILNEVRIFHKLLPDKLKITFGLISMSSLIFLRFSMSDEEQIVLLVLLHIIKEYQNLDILLKLSSLLINRNQNMSITISNCNEICNAPTNSSTAKMLYTFPKQSRFLKRKTMLCEKFYELKSTLSTRGAGFGYGSKFDFTRQLPHSPPPNSYHFSDSFHVSPKKGFAFGESRQKMMITGPLVDTILNKNPGPGNYEVPNYRSKISYSLSGKIQVQNKEQMNVPGPGKYPTAFCINKDGKYFHAKYKNSCVRDFGRVLGRCQTAANKLPGPGAYDVSTYQDISPKGKYCLSSSQNCLARSFGSSHRGENDYESKKTPGPGNYRIPSEFGYYASRKAWQQKSCNKENIEAKDEKHQTKAQTSPAV